MNDKAKEAITKRMQSDVGGPYVIQAFMKDEPYYFVGTDTVWGTDVTYAVLFVDNESALKVLFSDTCKRMGRSVRIVDL